MHRPGFRLTAPEGELHAAFAAARAELQLPLAFPDAVREEAERAASAVTRPDVDLTDVPFITLDPKGSTDLDQAMFLARDGSGFLVRYAIADVPAFVSPGGAIDGEARQRGQTMYAPNGRTPLHPERLSEDAASLLPDQDRPAFVWTFRLDDAGSVIETDLVRALVRSRAQLDYDTVQRDLDAGTADPMLSLLGEVGRRRIEQEQARGGASLAIPDQEVVASADGKGYELRMRPPHAVEDHNAQLSLMTGMAAAEIMLAGGVGILRTMPPASSGAIARLRRQAAALGTTWPKHMKYGALLRSLDPTVSSQLALLYEAASLFRGAAYTPFDGTAPPEDAREQAAIGAPYAHVTAPLRRLVDRFGLVCCEAHVRGAAVPDWARAALPTMSETMKASDRRAGALGRACVDIVEAALLAPRIGETFTATVVDLNERRGGALVQLTEPAVLAHCDGDGLPLGQQLQVQLAEADVAKRALRFVRAEPAQTP